jgi:V/A-type H+/Na+-transporting ATPase subunit I
LVRVRGLQRALDAEGMPAGAAVEPAKLVPEAEAALAPVLEEMRNLREAMNAAESEESLLKPLSGIEVDFAPLADVRSVRVLVGTCREDPTGRVKATKAACELIVAPSGSGFSVLAAVPTAAASGVERALLESGFTPAQVPPGSGTPRVRLQGIAAQKTVLSGQIALTQVKLLQLRDHWGPRLAAAEASLNQVVEKTQAPLRFGVTQTTFHLEGWAPVGHAKGVEEALLAKFGNEVYFHSLGDAPEHKHQAHAHEGHKAHSHEGHAHEGHKAHGHEGHAHEGHKAHSHEGHGHEGGHEGGHDDHGHDDHHDVDPKDEPPIHLSNPKPARPYEWILSLLARPRYQEIDPSKLMLLFFPLFFGLMVGDVAVGLLIVLFGLYLAKNKVIGIGGPAVSKAIVAGGIVSIVVGLFVFGEALGIHFVTENPDESSWEKILGLTIPYQDQAHGLFYKTGNSVAPGASGGMQTLAASSSEQHGILSPHSSVHLAMGGVSLGVYSKLHDVQALLVWSLIIALVHIDLGLLLGFRNVRKAHGFGLAMQEKGGWLLLQAGAALAILGWMSRDELGLTQTGWIMLGSGLGLAVASIALLWMGAAKVLGQGFIALLEIPSLFSNFVSYTRLAAIGASKAGLGLALGVICFETIGGGFVGWLLYLVGFLGITALAILTGSLQSLRLQFVEFFGKFFTGGGRPYVPFGRRAP